MAEKTAAENNFQLALQRRVEIEKVALQAHRDAQDAQASAVEALQEWTRHRPELEARGFGSGTEPTKRSQQSIVAELEGTNRDLFEAQGKLLGAKKGSPERRDLLERAEGIEIRAVHLREELAGAFDAISKA